MKPYLMFDANLHYPFQSQPINLLCLLHEHLSQVLKAIPFMTA